MTRAADLADLGSAYGGYNGFGFRNALAQGYVISFDWTADAEL